MVQLLRLFRRLACLTPTARYAICYRLTARWVPGPRPDGPRWSLEPPTYISYSHIWHVISPDRAVTELRGGRVREAHHAVLRVLVLVRVPERLRLGPARVAPIYIPGYPPLPSRADALSEGPARRPRHPKIHLQVDPIPQ